MKSLKVIIISILAMCIVKGMNAQNSYSLLDTEGKEIYKNDNCEMIYGLFEGYAVVLAKKADGSDYQGALINTTTGAYSVPFSAGYKELIPVMEGTCMAIGYEGLDYNGKPVQKGDFADYPFVALLDAKTGREIIPISAGYINISRIVDGKYHIAEKANEFCIYDTKGTKLFCKTGKYPTYANDGIFKYVMLEYNAEYDIYNKTESQITAISGKDILAKDHSYTSIYPFVNGLAKVSKKIDGKTLDGFIDTNGKLLIDCKYKYASDYKHGYITATLDEENVMINAEEKVIYSGKTLSYSMDNGYMKLYDDGKMGMIDATGKVILEPTYADIGDFEDGITWAKDADNKASVINDKGEVVFPLGRGLKFNDLKEGNLSYRMDGKMGLMTAEGKELLSPEYDRIEYYPGNHWAIKKGDKYGLYSVEKNEIVVKVAYDEIYPETSMGKFEDRMGDVSYGLTKGKLKGTYYNGKLIEPQYTLIGVPNDGVIPVVK